MAAGGFNPQDPIEDKGSLILLVQWGVEEAVGGVGVGPQELASLVGQGALILPVPVRAEEAEAMAAGGFNPQDPIEDKGALILLANVSLQKVMKERMILVPRVRISTATLLLPVIPAIKTKKLHLIVTIPNSLAKKLAHASSVLSEKMEE